MRTGQDIGAQPSPEYSVYIYHNSKKGHETPCQNWERLHVTANEKEALNQAKALYDSQKYRRVEIKRRIFDPKTDQSHDEIYKILEEKAKMVINPAIVGGVLFLMMAVFILLRMYYQA